MGTLEQTRQESAELHGMQSFSKDCRNILMWSHYGEMHCGICLGFDVTREIVRAIEYVDHVQVIADLKTLSQTQQLAIVDRLNWAKYKGWSYEKEVRARASREELDAETGLYFAKFEDNLLLREVIVGSRCVVPREEIDAALEGYSF